MNCKYCRWKGLASTEDNELARCPRCGEDTPKINQYGGKNE